MLADRTLASGTAPTSPAARPARNDELCDVAHFRAIVGHAPYPWQRRLYAALARGAVPDAVDIPTGLGKTASVLLALLARLERPALPRRVVYVVDRRAIVDQTAEAVRAWIERIAALPALARAFDACASHPAERPVGLGVLRGGLADDGAWRLDPARPAVLVGTVDMVGSRLLFSGYGDGRSRRAMHAGLLGHDALVMLDEAHLAPAFGALLRAVEGLQGRPEFRTITLSATGASGATVLGLTDPDYGCAAVRRRLTAAKSPRFVEAATATERIRRIHDAAAAHRTGAVAVFVERVSDARRIARGLVAALGPGAAGRVAVLTGTLRGHERAALAGGAVWRRFTPGRSHPPDAPSVYLVATAAGEVGVDLDADHAVMDLSTLDSMIQRLGRVNRVGDGDAEVTVVFTAREARGLRTVPTSYRERREAARAATLAVLRQLSSLCPRTLRALDPDTVSGMLCTPSPARPARCGGARGVRRDLRRAAAPAGVGLSARGERRARPRPVLPRLAARRGRARRARGAGAERGARVLPAGTRRARPGAGIVRAQARSMRDAPPERGGAAARGRRGRRRGVRSGGGRRVGAALVRVRDSGAPDRGRRPLGRGAARCGCAPSRRRRRRHRESNPLRRAVPAGDACPPGPGRPSSCGCRSRARPTMGRSAASSSRSAVPTQVCTPARGG